jgi:hypothetical protein
MTRAIGIPCFQAKGNGDYDTAQGLTKRTVLRNDHQHAFDDYDDGMG